MSHALASEPVGCLGDSNDLDGCLLIPAQLDEDLDAGKASTRAEESRSGWSTATDHLNSGPLSFPVVRQEGVDLSVWDFLMDRDSLFMAAESALSDGRMSIRSSVRLSPPVCVRICEFLDSDDLTCLAMCGILFNTCGVRNSIVRGKILVDWLNLHVRGRQARIVSEYLTPLALRCGDQLVPVLEGLLADQKSTLVPVLAGSSAMYWCLVSGSDELRAWYAKNLCVHLYASRNSRSLTAVFITLAQADNVLRAKELIETLKEVGCPWDPASTALSWLEHGGWTAFDFACRFVFDPSTLRCMSESIQWYGKAIRLSARRRCTRSLRFILSLSNRLFDAAFSSISSEMTAEERAFVTDSFLLQPRYVHVDVSKATYKELRHPSLSFSLVVDFKLGAAYVVHAREILSYALRSVAVAKQGTTYTRDSGRGRTSSWSLSPAYVVNASDPAGPFREVAGQAVVIIGTRKVTVGYIPSTRRRRKELTLDAIPLRLETDGNVCMSGGWKLAFIKD